MSWKEGIVDLLTTPWVIGSAIAGSLLKILGLLGVWHFLSGVAVEFFAPLAIFGGTVAPNIDQIPTDLAIQVLVGVAVVVVIVKLDSAIEDLRDKYT